MRAAYKVFCTLLISRLIDQELTAVDLLIDSTLPSQVTPLTVAGVTRMEWRRLERPVLTARVAHGHVTRTYCST